MVRKERPIPARPRIITSDTKTLREQLPDLVPRLPTFALRQLWGSLATGLDGLRSAHDHKARERDATVTDR
ncbi:MAG: hypothetical protein JWQ26_1706 [Modestobacter sp.]|jgi:hypothetical protein|nr:hypothetical protein [Modestobacter sp.]